MDQAGIIRDLLIWLEGHLDQPLSLDNVAAKAGYSKWHLQRMFTSVWIRQKNSANRSARSRWITRRSPSKTLTRCSVNGFD